MFYFFEPVHHIEINYWRISENEQAQKLDIELIEIMNSKKEPSACLKKVLNYLDESYKQRKDKSEQ